MHVVVPILLTSTLQSLCVFQFLFLPKLWSTFNTKKLTGCSKKVALLDQFTQTTCHFIRGFCSTWLFFFQTSCLFTRGIWCVQLHFSDSLTPYCGKLLLVDNFLKQNFSPSVAKTFLSSLSFSHNFKSDGKIEKWLTAAFFRFFEPKVLFMLMRNNYSSYGDVNVTFLLLRFFILWKVTIISCHISFTVVSLALLTKLLLSLRSLQITP